MPDRWCKQSLFAASFLGILLQSAQPLESCTHFRRFGPNTLRFFGRGDRPFGMPHFFVCGRLRDVGVKRTTVELERTPETIDGFIRVALVPVDAAVLDCSHGVG